MVDALIGGGLAPWGQAAALILALYIFLSLLAGLALAAALLFLLAWLREKSEQIKKLRPLVNRVNQALSASQRGETPPVDSADSRLARVATRVPQVTETLPAKASEIEQKVEGGSDRVANMVIEFYARTRQARGFARALFLPGLTRGYAPASAAHKELTEQLTQSERVEETNKETASREPLLEQDIVITQSSR